MYILGVVLTVVGGIGIIGTIIWIVLDNNKKDEVKIALNKAAPFIRGKLSEAIDIRHTPELKFIYDTSISYGEHIDAIIDKIHEEK